MYKLLSRRSYVLFVLLCCSFFSCEHYLELIKPYKPTKPLPLCRLIKEEGREYTYNEQGRLTQIDYFGYGNTPGTYPLILDYNEQGKVSGAFFMEGKASNRREFTYDEKGRLLRMMHYTGYTDEFTTDFSYEDNITHLHTYRRFIHSEGEVIQEVSWRDMYYKNGNVVRVVYKPAEGETVDTQYEYTSTPNRNYNLNNTIAFIHGQLPMLSKMLPLRSIENNSKITTYNWLLNLNGYPLNNGVNNEVIYEYECK